MAPVMKVHKACDPMPISLFGPPGVVASTQGCTQTIVHWDMECQRRLPIVGGSHGSKRRIDCDLLPSKEGPQMAERFMCVGNRPILFFGIPDRRRS